MSEPEKLVQVMLNIGVDGDLSQAEADALLDELQAQVRQQMAGSVDVLSRNSPEESQSKGEPLMTLAIVVIQYVLPKLIDVVFDMIKERRNSQVRAFAKVGGEQITLDSRTDLAELQEIQERVQVANAGAEVPERRFALLIGTTSYQDTRLNQLASPEIDVQALADVLRDPSIGGYDDVNLLVNQSSLAISQAVEQFFKRKANTDLLLLYFSGHGVRDEDGALYLAAQNTDLELLRATAVPSDFVRILMDRSKSERQVLILDCCYSGSFLHGSKAASLNVPVHAASAFEGNGFGRVVLTATDKTQLAWEGQRITGAVQKSVFTEHLIQGLKSGEADHDRDGWIGLEELYKYVYNRMVKTSRNQTPEMNVFNMKGSIILARNPRPKPMELPSELQSLVVHPYADVRLAAVTKLKEMFDSSPYGMALAARKALEKLVKDDSRMVSEAAGKALGMIPSHDSAPPEETAPLPYPDLSRPTPTATPIPPTGTPAAGRGGQGVPVSPGVAWWTQIKPPPGTRSGAGTKSGPALVEERSAQPLSRPPAATSAAASVASSSANQVYPAFRTPPVQKTSRLQEPGTLALVAGVLSLLLIFLPVSVGGLLVGLRAVKATPGSPRAVAGLVLSGIALAIQLIVVLVYMTAI